MVCGCCKKTVKEAWNPPKTGPPPRRPDSDPRGMRAEMQPPQPAMINKHPADTRPVQLGHPSMPSAKPIPSVRVSTESALTVSFERQRLDKCDVPPVTPRMMVEDVELKGCYEADELDAPVVFCVGGMTPRRSMAPRPIDADPMPPPPPRFDADATPRRYEDDDDSSAGFSPVSPAGLPEAHSATPVKQDFGAIAEGRRASAGALHAAAAADPQAVEEAAARRGSLRGGPIPPTVMPYNLPICTGHNENEDRTVQAMFSFANEDGWTFAKEQGGMRAYKRWSDIHAHGNHGPLILVKTVTVINANRKQLWRFFSEYPSCISECYETFRKGHIVERIRSAPWDLHEVRYMEIKYPFPLSNRDSIISSIVRVVDDHFVMANLEALRPDLPPKRGLVRASVQLSGYVGMPLPEDSSKTILISVLHTDSKFDIPIPAEKLMSEQVKHSFDLARVKAAIEKRVAAGQLPAD
eukprot:tig00021590_g22773.t1